MVKFGTRGVELSTFAFLLFLWPSDATPVLVESRDMTGSVMIYAISGLDFMPKIAYHPYLKRWKPSDTQQILFWSEMKFLWVGIAQTATDNRAVVNSWIIALETRQILQFVASLPGDRLRVGLREQKMLKGHLPRVI